MTSKEDFKKLREEYYNEFLNEEFDEIGVFNSIEKDLEILEIIKKWSFLDTFYMEDTDTTYDRFLCSIHIRGMKEDFEKVKEWIMK